MKELGISGWSPTSGAGQAEGVLVTDAAHSSDRIWTLELAAHFLFYRRIKRTKIFASHLWPLMLQGFPG